MAAACWGSRFQFLSISASNHFYSFVLSRNVSFICTRTSISTALSRICATNSYTLSKKTSCFRNDAKHFSQQGWLGVKASVLTDDKINKADLGCPICSRDITFTYKDVLFLSQFMSPRGYILNRRVTGVCRKQQRKLEKAIKISQRLGLLPKLAPAVQKELEEKKLAEKRNAAQSRN
ncbi:PREDICTED: uncharacterized protein LOC107331971 isoform X1 [Acropora digitifera]|uniref:uncharacterized protein LOC107331971 isoform X1 n=1 Tax=Acropora digitifera TaxID=70779 RepID=UPI00077B0606|nr:PREDICTED: uncharacterized protein LOC107331971 isoform X1 [Acropora digitifera]